MLVAVSLVQITALFYFECINLLNTKGRKKGTRLINLKEQQN